MTKNKIIRSSGAVLITALFLFAIFSACEKNDIKVVASEVNGTSSTSSSATGGAPCNPAANSASFSTNNFTNFNSLYPFAASSYGYYTLFVGDASGGYYKSMYVALPMSSAPVSSGTYSLNYSFFSSHYLSNGTCALRFYDSSYYGYGSSGTVYVNVSGSNITATFCGVTCKKYFGNNYLGTFTATGKISN